ncbi:MAG TPA: CAP domain-containing protein [Candidatus Binataceae bacterium]
MSVHSAGGRRSARIPNGLAKVIQFPAGQRRRKSYQRSAGLVIATMGLAAAGAAFVWIYLVPFIGFAPDLTAGMSAQEAEILRLVNGERRRAGAPALKSSQRLMLASRGHSYDMALRNYLGHKGPAGDTPAERVSSVGVDSAALEENLYLDRDADRAKLAERALQEWLRSPEHRANLLSPDFAITGVGIARAADGTAYVTQDFAK